LCFGSHAGCSGAVFLKRSISLVGQIMNRKRLLAGLCLLAGCCAAQTEFQSPIEVESGVRAKMRDGVGLVADVYRPADHRKHSVLLVRTPYDRGSESETCRAAAQHGYICVAQDVRGRYGSAGDWYPFNNEAADGYDTVEWAAALPDSDGKVGMFGDSYVGATQWLAGMARPPHLVAIQPTLTSSNYHDGWVYQGGALELWFDQTWTSILALNTLERTAMKNSPAADWAPALPLSNFPVLGLGDAKALARYYFDWLAHPAEDPYWDKVIIESHYGELPLAVRHVGGWYDLFLRGTLRNYLGMREHAPTPWAREHQELTIGPWIHDGPMDGKAGDLDFGAKAAFDRNQTILEWYDEILGGKAAGARKRVKIFVMGINQWREEDDWPLPGTIYAHYYLHSGGRANSSAGDGGLTTSVPGREIPDTFTYDPASPAPTRGGGLCCMHDQVVQQPSGVADQREVEKRADVLVYTTPPFERDFEVTGPVTAEIYVSSTATDTDLTAKLVDVWPNGFAQNLTDNIQRLRYRNSATRPEALVPGKIYKVVVEVGATSDVFRAGHRLRVEISSSNFPRFDRNLNTMESPEEATSFTRASNSIHHDLDYPSAIVLPVIPAR
jgi:uncharacterized protein